MCLDILKEQWSPAFSIKKILLSISYLLQQCNPGMYLRVYVFSYVYLYVCSFVCMYVHTNIYTHTYNSGTISQAVQWSTLV